VSTVFGIPKDERRPNRQGCRLGQYGSFNILVFYNILFCHVSDDSLRSDTVADFSIVSGLAGGALIGIAAVILMGLLGRIAGISGIASALIPPWDWENVGWRAAFVAGLVVAPGVYYGIAGVEGVSRPADNLFLMAISGLLVGFGTVLGSGCTSGHGVCGLARLSPRSLTAVVTFMATAAVVVFALRHLWGG